MASTVEGYLAELRAALAGADPALVQDAVYDAEEYLRSAVAERGEGEAAVAGAIDAYGTPEEVATAYREAEIAVARVMRGPAPRKARTPLGRFFGIVADPTAWGALFYMVLSLATGIAYFTVVVTGLSLSVGLAVLIVGVPMALLCLAVVRAISLAEGRIVEGLLGVRMPRKPRTVGQTGNVIERVKDWLTDARTWTTMLYMLLQLPLGIAYFTTVVTAFATSLGVMLLPFYELIFNQPVFYTFDYAYYVDYWAMPLLVVAGVLGMFLTLWLAKGVGYLHGMYAKAMLVGRFEAASPAMEEGVR